MGCEAPPEPLVLELKFKGSRKEYYRENPAFLLEQGDYCIVAAERGRECGKVVEKGLIASLRAGGRTAGEVLRAATDEDMTVFWENAAKEERARTFCLGRISTRRLEMKLADVEWQFDSSKVTFYFTAERRVDFRELVKDLAAEFRTRIELRQIGVRDEAKRRDGFGSCGRRLCCSSWLPDFQPITLKMARDQQLSLSPNKISGLCGRLLCCLSYEVKQYRDVMKTLPPAGARVKAGAVEGYVAKLDVFNRRILIRNEDGKDTVMPENAWRPEFLVALRSPKKPRERRSERPARGAAAPAQDAPELHGHAEHHEEDLAHLEDAPGVPHDEPHEGA